jgi:hypothetical protein
MSDGIISMGSMGDIAVPKLSLVQHRWLAGCQPSQQSLGLNINGGSAHFDNAASSLNESVYQMVLVEYQQIRGIADCSQLDQAFGSCREFSNSRVEQGEGIVRRLQA